MNFNFRLVESKRDLSFLVNFLITQGLNYPNYESWVQKAEHEIDQGYKKAILAFSDDYLAGNLIYQPHKELPRVKELKNMRIHPSVRRRYFAQFILKQAEVDERERYDLILCDVRSSQTGVISLLRSMGYQTLVTTSLYDQNNMDTIMIKVINESSVLSKLRC